MIATDRVSEIDRAIERTQTFFRTRQTKAGVLARQLGRPDPRDPALTEHLIRERRLRTRMDGSIDGSLVLTTLTVCELLELGCPLDHAAVVRTLGYVLTKQDQAGHAFEGCSPDRHDQRRCHHFVSGFFSPAPRDQELAPLTFPWGIEVTGEEEARFAASCFALRVVLRGREERRDGVQRHLESLVELTCDWQAGDTRWPVDLVLFALGGLALAPPEYRRHSDRLVEGIAALQQPTGEWHEAHLFHTLDALLATPTRLARDCVCNAVPRLCGMQRESGAFDETGDETKALIALRAMKLALTNAV